MNLTYPWRENESQSKNHFLKTFESFFLELIFMYRIFVGLITKKSKIKSSTSVNGCETGSGTACFSDDTTQSTLVSEGVEEKIVFVLICLEDFSAIFTSAPARLFTDACK